MPLFDTLNREMGFISLAIPSRAIIYFIHSESQSNRRDHRCQVVNGLPYFLDPRSNFDSSRPVAIGLQGQSRQVANNAYTDSLLFGLPWFSMMPKTDSSILLREIPCLVCLRMHVKSKLPNFIEPHAWSSLVKWQNIHPHSLMGSHFKQNYRTVYTYYATTSFLSHKLV